MDDLTPSLRSPFPPHTSLIILTRGKPWPQKKKLSELLTHTLDITLKQAFSSPYLSSFFNSFRGSHLEINLLLAHSYFVRSLNKKWRHHDADTNVLSFPSFETPGLSSSFPLPNPLLLGEIVLSYEKCLEESYGKKPFLSHIQHLFAHGILHLLGFDHEHEKDALIMESLEVSILHDLSLPNPYLHS